MDSGNAMFETAEVKEGLMPNCEDKISFDEYCREIGTRLLKELWNSNVKLRPVPSGFVIEDEEQQDDPCSVRDNRNLQEDMRIASEHDEPSP